MAVEQSRQLPSDGDIIGMGREGRGDYVNAGVRKARRLGAVRSALGWRGRPRSHLEVDQGR
jgi:hypothetical protein